MARTSAGVAIGALALLSAACGDPPTPTPRPSVTDSSGVRIIMNSEPRWRNGEGWRISDEPTVSVGARVNAPPEEIFGTITTVLHFDNGVTLVVDRFAAEFRFFGLDGKMIRSTGRKGVGPGEFPVVESVRRIRGDTLVVRAGSSNSLIWLDSEGTYIATNTLAEVRAGLCEAMGECSLLDGHYIGSAAGANSWRPLAGTTDAAEVFYSQLEVADRNGRAKADIGLLPIRVSSPPPHVQIFTPWRFYAAREYFYTTFPSEYRIDAYDHLGNVTRSVRREVAPAVVLPDEVEAFRDSRMEMLRRELGAEPNPNFRRALEASLPAATHPVISGLMVDALEHIWVRDYRVREDGVLNRRGEYGDGAPQRWQVFTPEGEWLGTVQVPERLTITEIGAHHIAGIWRDENLMESARVYALQR